MATHKKAVSKNHNKKKKKQQNRSRIFLAVGVFLIVCIGWTVVNRHFNYSTAEGVKYIKSLEQEDTKTVKKELKKKRDAERKAAIAAGEFDIFGMFEDYVIFGDSRVMGFSFYGFLEDARVLADSGATIKNIQDHLDEVERMHPSNIFFSYGVNDMGMNINAEEGGYGQIYADQIKKVLDIVPDANIYVVAIMPCTPDTLENNPAWKQVNTYNKEIEKMCKENKWNYINVNNITDGGNADIYQSDGIHYLSTFYSEWAAAIFDEISD